MENRLLDDLPIEDFTVPESRKRDVAELEIFSQHIDFLPPVSVRWEKMEGLSSWTAKKYCKCI
jgi:hypothetical protein